MYVRNIEILIRLIEGCNLAKASRKGNATLTHTIKLIRLFQFYGLIRLQKIKNRSKYYVPTEKGKFIVEHLKKIRNEFNAQKVLMLGGQDELDFRKYENPYLFK